MSTAQEHYAAVAAGFSHCLKAIRPDDWVAATPCPEWTARELAAHVVMTHRRVLSMLDHGTIEELADYEDVPRAWAGVTGAMASALADPGVAATLVPSRGGEMPFEDLVDRMVCADTLVHTWDLARAVGADETLDPEVVTHVAAFLREAGDRIRVPGGFGPAISPPAGADEQTAFLLFTGRQV